LSVHNSPDSDAGRDESQDLERSRANVEATGDSPNPANGPKEGFFAAQYRAHSGPLPDQDWFSGLESLHPGATELILRDFTEERQHQRRMQEKAIHLDAEVFSKFSNYQRSRLWIAGGLALFLATGGLALIFLDKAVYGFVLLVAEITGLMGVFLVGNLLATDDRNDLDDDELDRLLAEADEEAE
jgi:hypothetical protein